MILFIQDKINKSREEFRVYILEEQKYKFIWINYENAIIELISDSEFGMGVCLTKCFDKVEFFGNTNNWLKFMKRFAVRFYRYNTQQNKYKFQSFLQFLYFTIIFHFICIKKLNKIQFGEQYKGKNLQDNLDLSKYSQNHLSMMIMQIKKFQRNFSN
ncbi:unnamed protein product [Paramecium sonneborni]|uniref:Uncharacterized protein n=1 Tax=Paramecium sonneborni TaxID=65129 RepID=A0A8S1L1P9_9CILI|nr:unnamed protein product [Paramecium sonneborni]